MNSRVESIIKFLPFLTGYIILCGIAKAIIYYQVFGLRILPYLDLSECLLLFLDDFILTVIIFITYYLLIKFLRDNNFTKTKENDKLNYSLIYKRIVRTGYIGFPISLTACFSAYHLGANYYLVEALSVLTLMLLVTNIVFYIIDYFIKNHPNEEGLLPLFEFTVTIGFVLAISFMLYKGFIEAYSIRKRPHKRDNCIAFLTDNRKIQTNDSLIFIGKTYNYIFFYNLQSKMKTIIPTSDIKELKIE